MKRLLLLAAELHRLEQWNNRPWYSRAWEKAYDFYKGFDRAKRKDMLFGLWASVVLTLSVFIMAQI